MEELVISGSLFLGVFECNKICENALIIILALIGHSSAFDAINTLVITARGGGIFLGELTK